MFNWKNLKFGTKITLLATGSVLLTALAFVVLTVWQSTQVNAVALEQIDLIEIHEAFAVQTLANLKELGLTEKDYSRVNVNGSCIALGHPLGATGARILTTLVYEMQRRNVRYGLIAICGGGGMGVSGLLEKL